MTRHKEIEIPLGSVTSKSLLVLPEGAGPHPCALIFPQWSGRSPSEEAVAEKLAAFGYAAVACDLYGGGRRGSGPEENEQLMRPLMDDRGGLRTRLLAIAKALAATPDIDEHRIAAAGFCFGGLCALDLARAGAQVKGVASFHGLLSPPEGLPEPEVRASIAVYHGWDDPMAPPEHVVALGEELTRRHADWYLMGFGHAVHAFTREDADSRDAGVAYDAAADRRSWRDFTGFLEERLT